MEHLLSAIIFLPIFGALIALLFPERAAKWLCTLVAILTFAISVPLATNYGKNTTLTLERHYQDSILPKALGDAGFARDVERRAAVERMRAEKEELEYAEKVKASDPTSRAAVEELAKASRERAQKAREAFAAAAGPEKENGYKTFKAAVSDLDEAANGLFKSSIRFVEHAPWIPTFKINYLVGIDGLSLPLILLTTLLTVLCLLYSWQFDYDKPVAERRPLKAFYILFLILEAGLVGVFCSLDFFLFFVFWEIVLLPSYFLIGIWGGENRNYASIKFFIYTLVGSITMLIAMLTMYFHFEPHTFNVLALTELAQKYGGTELYSTKFQAIIFVLLFLGFAIKVPVFPFHTWLPDAHVQAPTAFSVMLAGVMLKMGGYGFFRFSLPLCHDAAITSTFVWTIGILGAINIVYGAFVAMGQSDFKSLVAYSSVSHMGYVLLGMAAVTYAGLDGAALQMVTHGISSAGMFFIVGVIYDRAHHRDLARFGGIALQMPKYFGFSLVILFTSLGLPGLCGFVAEAFVFLGAWQSHLLPKWITIFSMMGIIMGAAYILWTIRRVFLGPLTVEKYKHFPDLEWRETVALAPLAALCIAVGVYPRLVTEHLGLENAIQAIYASTMGLP